MGDNGPASSAPIDHDDLLARLRARAADPARRTTARPSRLTESTRTMGLDGLAAMLQGLNTDLQRVVTANRQGRVDPAGTARAERLREAMSSPAFANLPSPAAPGSLEAAEAALGVTLPTILRRGYTELADGGFGPGTGLLPLRDVVAAHARLRTGDELPRGRAWPNGLIPLVDADPGFDCLEAATGRLIAWDPDGLSERSSEARFAKSFSEIAPSAEAWLDTWVDSRTQAEILAAAAHRSQVDAARTSRARIAAMTPAERAAMGLPAVGWEKVAWGGLGLDEDDAS